MTVLAGPGGYLAWDARTAAGTRAFVMHSTDLLEWDDVDVSAWPSLAEAIDVGDIAIYATADEWIFVPSRSGLSDAIFTSRDGLVWQEAPRPPEMDRPWWIAVVGDRVHAFEGRRDEDMRLRLWTWRRGTAAGPPERVGRRRAFGSIGPPPVAWRGDWVTLALEWPPRSRAVVLWRYAGDAGEGEGQAVMTPR
jgi:hypothetical protein